MFEPVNLVNLNGSAGAGGGYVPVRKKIVIPQKQQQQQQQFFVGSQSNEVVSSETAKAQSNAAKVRFTGSFKSYIAELNAKAAIDAYSNL